MQLDHEFQKMEAFRAPSKDKQSRNSAPRASAEAMNDPNIIEYGNEGSRYE